LLIICHTTQAQSTITFYTSDGYEPVSDVAVFNYDKSFTITSNQEGKIKLPKSLLDDEVIFFRHTSYLDESKTVKYLRDKLAIILIPEVIEMEEFIVAASKSKERLEEISNKVDVIKASETKIANPQTTADLLTQTGNVYIQKSQMGGGSPIIRGFEANKVLIAVDGVKLNNAIYRGGHLQNVITIDPAIIERTEVVYGPGSLIYGSDAIGGVMHFVTKDPLLSKTDKTLFDVNSTLRYATANQEKTAHLDFSIGKQKWGVLTSVSFSDFDDLIIGKNRTEEEGNWGQMPYITTLKDGIELTAENPNPNKLVSTGYHQIDALQKWVFKPNSQNKITANLQYSTSSDIPRFDKLNDIKFADNRANLKWGKWVYGPQQRFLSSVQHQFTSNDFSLFDQLTTTAAFQKIDEDRIKRKFASAIETTNQEDVYVYSLNADANKQLNNKHNLQYGMELTHNDVASTAYQKNVDEGRLDDFTLTRYPDEGSSMTTGAVYVRHKWKLNDAITLTDGLRFSVIRLAANFSDEVDIPTKTFQDNYAALTGGLGLSIKATPVTKVFSNIGTGFRAPNIDDAGKFFDPQDGMVVVPNFNIKPEYILNADLGIHHKVMDKATVRVDGFYNYILNAIVRRTDNLNGLDSLSFEGTPSAIFSNQNAGKAVVAGFSLGLDIEFNRIFSSYYNHNFTYGKDLSENVPLGHIPPQYGEGGIKISLTNVESVFYTRYNGAKPIEEYSPFGEDKESEALESGTPGWYTLNFKVAAQINPSIHLSAGVENIFDKHYKPFASGISSSGRNFIVALRTGLGNIK